MINTNHQATAVARHRVLVTSYYDRRATDPVLARLDPIAQVIRVDHGRRLKHQELIDHLPHTDVVLISDEEIDGNVLKAAPRLSLICADGVGVDSVDIAAATAAGVIVNNAPFVHEANGDFTMGLILAVMRRIVAADRGIRAGRWNDRASYLGHGLSGCTLGLLGFGRAAKAVAERARGFGLTLLAHCRRPNAQAAKQWGVDVVELEELLRRSDIISIHVPLTEQTRGMIGRAQFDHMKQGVYLINTSRGAVVDERALVEALRTGKVAGAAIDVFAQEPPATDHPLFGMDNVVVTPHIASDARDAFRAVFDGTVDDILRFLRGERPRHVVNPDVLVHPRCKHLKEEP